MERDELVLVSDSSEEDASGRTGDISPQGFPLAFFFVPNDFGILSSLFVKQFFQDERKNPNLTLIPLHAKSPTQIRSAR